MNSKTKRVVILGCGFAGIEAAKILSRRSFRENFSVTIIDRNNYHLFQPLLYQVATAGLSVADITSPIRGVFRNNKNIEVLLAEVLKIDKENKKVTINTHVGEDEESRQYTELEYDYLLVATGAESSYFGHDDWAQYAPGLKTIEDAIELRNKILMSFERAETTTDVEERKKHLTFVVVGGGPTGVEMAGAIAELARFTLKQDFRRACLEETKVILLEGFDRILSSFPETLSQAALQDLQKLGVDVQFKSFVTEIGPKHVVAGGKTYHAYTIVWAPGVKASNLGQTFPESLDKVGRVKVEQTLNVSGYPEIYVGGDLAHVPMSRDKQEQLTPGVAPAAMQMGKQIAKNIVFHSSGLPLQDFTYFNKGNMATIGRSSAVVDGGFYQLRGFLAWLIWVVVHIYFLVGFKNRVVVFFQWILAYFFYQKGSRVILTRFKF